MYHRRILNHFWKGWRNLFLHQLSVRNKWKQQSPAVQVGDVVLIADDNTTCRDWPMDRIIEIYSGEEGLIRTLLLQTQ